MSPARGWLATRGVSSVEDRRDDDDRPVSSWCPLGRLALLKLAYFAFLASCPTIIAFGGLVFESKGVSKFAVGWISAVAPLMMLLILTPGVAFVERRGLQRELFYASCIATMVFTTIACVASDHLVVVVAGVLLGVVQVYANPILDAHVQAVLGPDRVSHWGQYRVYGTVGWAAASQLVSSLEPVYGWGAGAVVCIAGTLVAMWCVYETPVRIDRNNASTDGGAKPKTSNTVSVYEVLRFAAHTPRALLFLGSFAVQGFALGVFSFVHFPYLVSIGVPTEMLGVAIIASVVIEIPLLQFGNGILDRFSDGQLATIGMLGWLVRVGGTALVTAPWLHLVLQLFNGVTFAFPTMAVMRFYRTEVPAHLSTTALSLHHAVVSGGARILAMVLSGWLFDAVGPASLLLWVAGFLAVDIGLFVLLASVLPPPSAPNTKQD